MRAAALAAAALVAASGACRHRSLERDFSETVAIAISESDRRVSAGDPDGALSVLAAATKDISPAYSEIILVQEARIESGRGRDQSAISLCDKAITLKASAGAGLALLAKANILLKMGRKQESDKVFLQVVTESDSGEKERKAVNARLKATRF